MHAQLGRTLLPEDERPGATAAVMSAAAWQLFFGGDPAVLGRAVTLNGQPFTIVGVMPPGFDYPERTTMFWTAQAPRPGGGTRTYGNFVAKLKPGVSIAAAADEANVIGAALRTPTIATGYGAGTAPAPRATPTMGVPLVPETDATSRPRFEILSVKDLVVAPIRPALRILSVAVVLVLLIVCANVANLLLARGTAREREIGVRLAIGAGRGRIVRQLVTESAVLSLMGGIAGVVVAAAGVRLVKMLATVDTPRLFQLSINLGNGSLLPRVDELGVDRTLLVFAAAVALVSGVVFGIAPAILMARVNYTRAISAGSAARFDSARPGRGTMRSMLVLAQIATSTTLLIGAGLLVHTFVRLLNVDPGYNPKNVLTFILGVFAGIAGFLAAIGVYGVLAYTVAQRSNEIGVRMALGAPPGAVLRSVLTRGMTLAGVGVAAGLAGAAGMTRYFASMLFEITPLDPRTYAAVAISFLLIAALACFVPAHRATRIDPVSALRE